MIRTVFAVLILLVALSCSPVKKPETSSSEKGNFLPLAYAKAFSIEEKPDCYILRTFHPMQVGEILQEFRICHSDSLGRPYRPPENLAVLSTTYIAYLKALGEIGSIRCISNGDLVCDSSLQTRIGDGLVRDIGNDVNFDTEALLESSVDLALYYDFGPATSDFAIRIEKLGVKVLRVGEYLEMHPLGKAEWIKFFGILFNKKELADSIFESIRTEYESLAEKYGRDTDMIRVFTGLPWKGQWYQPGGASFESRFISDAGGNYLWKENTSVSGMLLDREVIFEKALDAGLWLNPGNANSLEDITSMDERFERFRSVRSGNVFNNNARMNEKGGNDYWESGILRPQRILRDLINIVHATDSGSMDLYYYKKLK